MLWHYHLFLLLLKAGRLHSSVLGRRFQWHSVAGLSVRAASFSGQTQTTGRTQACLKIFRVCIDSVVPGQLLHRLHLGFVIIQPNQALLL